MYAFSVLGFVPFHETSGDVDIVVPIQQGPSWCITPIVVAKTMLEPLDPASIVSDSLRFIIHVSSLLVVPTAVVGFTGAQQVMFHVGIVLLESR